MFQGKKKLTPSSSLSKTKLENVHWKTNSALSSESITELGPHKTPDTVTC